MKIILATHVLVATFILAATVSSVEVDTILGGNALTEHGSELTKSLESNKGFRRRLPIFGGDDDDDDSVSVPFTTVSSFEILTTTEAKERCNLHKNAVAMLNAQGFTKILCPFGVLVVGDSAYPDDGLKYGANLIANILDNNNDGSVDDAAVLDQLAQKGSLGHGPVLMCGSTKAKEQKEVFFGGIFSYSFSCQTWRSFGNELEYKAILFEELFHMIHQNGWALSYPDIFGVNDYTSSVVCRETARHQCTSPGYFHPENICPKGSTLSPGSPQPSPLQGTCNEPNCDCIEFYRQAATAYMDWEGDLDFWYADHMPTNKANFVSMASSEMLSVMESPVYNQPQAPLSGVYTQNGMTGTGRSITRACTLQTLWCLIFGPESEKCCS